MTETEKGGRMPPEPTKAYKLGEWLGTWIRKTVRLIIGVIMALMLVTLGLAVAAAFIILFSVIIAVIAMVCALIVLCLPFSTFFGLSTKDTLKAKLDDVAMRASAAAEAASNVHPINP